MKLAEAVVLVFGRLTFPVTAHVPSALLGRGVSPSGALVVEVSEAVTPPEVFTGVEEVLSVQLTVQARATSSVPEALKVIVMAPGEDMFPVTVQA